ncbi:50S ribosomal protein L20 [Candidatus Parcubacteria bacterium]|nr:50S ribosomal protein L20 [Candidatus Parcubacteria bacterium]
MPRVKGGVISAKRRRNVLKRAKGYRHERSKKERRAKESLVHAGKSAFAHRRDKKNDMRQLWIVRLNAALRENGAGSYSTFVARVKKAGVQLDRKVLSTLAKDRPEVFKRVLAKIG